MIHRDPAEVCRMNGWIVGTRLVGDEGYGPTTIEITAIGERAILAKAVSGTGAPSREGAWNLDCREWVEEPRND